MRSKIEFLPGKGLFGENLSIHIFSNGTQGAQTDLNKIQLARKKTLQTSKYTP